MHAAILFDDRIMVGELLLGEFTDFRHLIFHLGVIILRFVTIKRGRSLRLSRDLTQDNVHDVDERIFNGV